MPIASQADLKELHGARPQRSEPRLVQTVVVMADAAGRDLVCARAQRCRGEGRTHLGDSAEGREQPSLHEAHVRHARNGVYLFLGLRLGPRLGFGLGLGTERGREGERRRGFGGAAGHVELRHIV